MLDMAAFRALVDMAAELRRAAGFDGSHGLEVALWKPVCCRKAGPNA